MHCVYCMYNVYTHTYTHTHCIHCILVMPINVLLPHSLVTYYLFMIFIIILPSFISLFFPIITSQSLLCVTSRPLHHNLYYMTFTVITASREPPTQPRQWVTVPWATIAPVTTPPHNPAPLVTIKMRSDSLLVRTAW